jgi:hypothetical protein
MKKKNYLLIIILSFVSNVVYSQAVLNHLDLTPNIGETHTIHMCDSVNEGPGGINQTWNFSAVSCATTFSINWTSSIGSSLPTASIVRVVGTDSAFYNQTNNYIEALAISNPTTGFAFLIDTQRQLLFPLTYGSSLTDSFKYNPYTTPLSAYTQYVSGKMTYIVDGYGTIILPSGTYSNVLRMKQIEIRKDSTAGIGTDIDSTVTFGWLKADNHIALAYVSKRYFNGATSPNPASFYYLDAIVTSLDDGDLNSESSFTLFPNPVSNKCHLTFIKPFDDLKFKLFDMLGTEIPLEYDKLLSTSYTFNPINQINGIYTLKIFSKNELLISKKIHFVN